MKSVILAGLALLSVHTFASTRYVDLNSTNATPPFTDWTTAATNIQDAVDVSANGDLVLVTNGIYANGGAIGHSLFLGALTNRVAISKRLTLQSINGPTVTSIQGYQIPGMTNGDSAIRCVFLTNGATLIGFTLTNGATGTNIHTSENDLEGGGVFCYPPGAVVSNCIIIGNVAVEGGGAFGGKLNSCQILNNTSRSYGGGAVLSCALNSCLVAFNSAPQGGGGYYCNFNNCLLISNTATKYDGGAARYSTLTNCTVCGNTAVTVAGGVSLSSAYNSVVFYNNASNDPNHHLGVTLGYYFNYCCTTPLPAGTAGNLTNEPALVDLSMGDFHFHSNSPCINSGENDYVRNSTDLDGNLRIVGGTVDIGAYEYQSPSSVLSYAFAQRFGLPTDGSADFADTDTDGMNNWQEWVTGTVPTNSISVLQMFSPSNSASGWTTGWQSVTNRTYFLQRASGLDTASAFSAIQSNIVGQPGTTTFTDSSATNNNAYFYRVGVQ